MTKLIWPLSFLRKLHVLDEKSGPVIQCEGPAARNRSSILPKNSNSVQVCEHKKRLKGTEKIRTICPIFPDVSSSHFVQHVGFHRRNDDWDASRGAKPDPIPRSSTDRPEMSQDMCKMPNKKPWFLGGSINRGWDNISVFFCFMFMLDEQQN